MTLLAGLDAAWRGDLAGVNAAMRAPGGEALAAHRALMLGEALPGAQALSMEGRRVDAIARVRDALLRWDAGSLRTHGTNCEPGWARCAEAWAELLEGRAPPSIDLRTDDPALRIECTTLRAWSAFVRGDLPGATTSARRASRMARTESLPRQEYLASLVLARVRRASGRAFAATRILAAIERVAPTQWRRWLGWESAFAGGALGPLAPLVALTGQRAEFDAERAARAAELRGCGLLSADFARAAALLDPHIGPPDDATRRFVSGASPALGGVEAVGGPGGGVWVLRDGDTKRRVLSAGLAFCDASRVEPSARAAKAASVLALAEEVSVEAFFTATYGFAYVPELHDGVLRVLLHRTRDALEPVAELARVGGALRLRPRQAFAVPDPRVSARDPIVRALSLDPGRSARELAEALRLPVRTVQNRLRALLEEGVCVSNKSGRRVAYAIEDTTFREPTRSAGS